MANMLSASYLLKSASCRRMVSDVGLGFSWIGRLQTTSEELGGFTTYLELGTDENITMTENSRNRTCYHGASIIHQVRRGAIDKIVLVDDTGEFRPKVQLYCVTWGIGVSVMKPNVELKVAFTALELPLHQSWTWNSVTLPQIDGILHFLHKL